MRRAHCCLQTAAIPEQVHVCMINSSRASSGYILHRPSQLLRVTGHDCTNRLQKMSQMVAYALDAIVPPDSDNWVPEAQP